ncbi:MAG: hypothetical protein QXM00_11410 [Candidatus Bathyarchaeia archaeon]
MPWFILTAMHWENFSNRFMIFGTLPAALASTYTISVSRKLKNTQYFILMLLPLSIALAFFPSTFMLFSHTFEFSGGKFIALHMLNDTLVVTDEYARNFIAFYNPYVKSINTISEITIFNLDPDKVFIPTSTHILFRSIRQDIQAFISHLRDPESWGSLDNSLSRSHDLCYNTGYARAWFRP